jgi:glycosyltransferase involved in cell wall biosynthesis
MRFLFIHQNYPGQFKHLAAALAAMPEHQVVAVVDAKNKREVSAQPNVWLISYPSPKGASKETHWYLHSYEGSIRRGQQVAKIALELSKKGFVPDVICVHAGWGEALFLRDVFPNAVIVDYFEFFYRTVGSDVGFDKEFQQYNLDDICRIRVRNSCHLLSLETCDWGLTPTAWQASQFPEVYRSKMNIIHEGVDTDVVRPDPDAAFRIPQGPAFTAKDQVITFVNRNLEPYRGFHIFMRALPKILKQNPKAHVVLLGGDEVSYGRPPQEGGSWKQKMLEEVGAELDMKRVHFVGKLPYERYLQLLQVSSAHVYLTYPFVLSWSMLESMAAGCVVIASNTAPVTEVIEHGHDGLLVDFFDVEGLASTVTEVLENPENYQSMRSNARETITARYDLKKVCLPQQISFLQGLPVQTGKA